MALGLSRNQRVRTSREFQELFRLGKRVRGPWLTLWVHPFSSQGTQSSLTKLGIVVSQKVSKNATERNLWKRRIREAFRKNQKSISQGFKIVVRPSQSGAAPAYEVLEKELLNLIKKSGVLDPSGLRPSG